MLHIDLVPLDRSSDIDSMQLLIETRRSFMNGVQPSRLWWSQLRIPLAIFVVTATVFALTPLDEHIARAVFFDSASAQWIGGHSCR